MSTGNHSMKILVCQTKDNDLHMGAHKRLLKILGPIYSGSCGGWETGRNWRQGTHSKAAWWNRLEWLTSCLGQRTFSGNVSAPLLPLMSSSFPVAKFQRRNELSIVDMRGKGYSANLTSRAFVWSMGKGFFSFFVAEMYFKFFLYFRLHWIFSSSRAFLRCSEWGLLSLCGMRASHCGGFSSRAQPQ